MSDRPVPRPGGAPFPGPLQASLLALLGVFIAQLIGFLMLDFATPTTAAGVATVVGVGAAGLLGAAHVPPPHAERIGLRGLRWRHVPALLLMLPVALLAAQLDPLLAKWLPPPDVAERVERMRQVLPTGDGLALVETLVVAVGLAPVVEEWLFRGVIQQGLVAHLGPVAGIVTTALLFALGHGGGGLSAQSTVAVVAQIFAIGLAFGYVRHATGSLFAAIALHAGVNALAVLSLHAGETGAVPGADPASPFLPGWLIGAAGASVALGAWWLRRIAPAPLRPEPPSRREDDSWPA